MKFFRQIAIALAASVCAFGAASQTYPDRPIRIVVPFPAGGGTDSLTRLIANAATTKYGWTVVVENKPGAGGNLALDTVAKAKPDGYTLVMAQTDNAVLNPLLYSKLPYDPIKDFEPIGTIARGAAVLVVKADSPYKSLADIVAAAKAKPGVLTFASPGTGTVAHLIEQLWEGASGIKLTHVPYRGVAQALPDLIGGQVDMYMGSVPTMQSHIEGGKVRALGVTSGQRSSVLKTVPTYTEAGIKGVELASVWGLMAPAGTPKTVIDKWNAAINELVVQADVRQKILDSGGEIIAGTPRQMAEQYAADRNKLAPVVQKANIKLD
ncbi:tripartite tricarboxylate transporter substrate binding protein [Caenimonas sp. SL110]|uniref:Bug family tripartite tricarboxylate transporter substrate binding protein n=1 Tax=Caenimonas sp. SL110 TaxID=1450524 RepID=UPI0006530B18|nr:tripartite tricarboxylate transporter substrate binding protein [Caenimonas sp. SL110]